MLLLLFPVIEARFASSPLVPPKAFTRPLRIANGVVFLFSAALFPMWYVSSLYLQQVLGLSPLEAGLDVFPMALTIMVSASRAGKLVGRFGVRPVLCGGLILMMSGMLLFTRIGTSGSAIGLHCAARNSRGHWYRFLYCSFHHRRNPGRGTRPSRPGFGIW